MKIALMMDYALESVMDITKEEYVGGKKSVDANLNMKQVNRIILWRRVFFRGALFV